MSRSALYSLVTSKVLTGGRRTKAVDERAVYNAIIAEALNGADDANVAGGYMKIDSSGLVNISFIKSATPSGLFLRDDGTWQAASGGGAAGLSANIAVDNTTGSIPITTEDGAIELRVLDGGNGYFINSIGVVGLTDTPFVNPNKIQLAETALLLGHDTELDLDSPKIYLQQGIMSDAAEQSKLRLLFGSALLSYSNGLIVAQSYHTGSFSQFDWSNDTGDNGYLQISAARSKVFHNTLIELASKGIEGTFDDHIYFNYNDGGGLSGYLRIDDSITDLQYAAGSDTGRLGITASQSKLSHTSKINFDAPVYYFATASSDTVPYFDSSSNLVSSVITPTELGYLTGATSNIQAQISALVSGLAWKDSVRARAASNITLSGPQTIDGVAVIAGDRVLVTAQSFSYQNGIYDCAAGAWTRSSDADTGTKILQATVAVEEGTLYADKQYVCTTNAPIVINTTPLSFVLVGGTTYVGITNRITVTGNVIDIDNAALTLENILTINPSTGNLDITSVDGNSLLSVVDNIVAMGWGGHFISVQPLEVRMQYNDGSVTGGNRIGNTQFGIAHDVLIAFDSPLYNFTNLTPGEALALDGSGNLITFSIPGTFNLESILGIGPSTGNLSITSPDTLSTLNIFDGQVLMGYYGVSASGELYASSTGAGFDFIDGGNGGSAAILTTDFSITHSAIINLDSPAVNLVQALLKNGNYFLELGGGSFASNLEFNNGTTTIGRLQGSASSALLYWTNSTVNGGVTADVNKNNVFHTVKLSFDSPIYNFNQATASRVPYFDASKNLVESAITPTELGYLTGASSNLQTQIDALVSGLSWKQAVRARTTANIVLSGAQTIDGVSVIAGDRVLVMNQSLGTDNGIYLCASGAWSRTTDANTGAKILQATCAVEEGTLYADKQYVCTTDAPIVIGATSIAFALVGGTTYVGTTNQIDVTGNVISISATYLGQSSITTVGTVVTGVWNATQINYAYIAAMTSAQLAGIISDETGSGALVFASAPSLVNPLVGTQSALDNSFKAASTGYADTADAALLLKIDKRTLIRNGFGGF